MKTLFITCVLVFMTFALTQCRKKDSPEQQQSEVTQYTCPMDPQIVRDKPGTCPICGMDLVKMTDHGEDAVMLTESQIKLANITTTLTRFEDMGEQTILEGKLMVNEDQTAVVSSRVQGRIEKLFVKEAGQRVLQGQELYVVYSETLLTLQSEYLLALRQMEELKDPRYESFLKASEKKLVLYGMSRDQVQQLAMRKTTESKFTFLSPAAGVVTRIDATEGQYVSEGTVLYRIEKIDRIWAEAEMYPGESSQIRPGDVVRVQVSGYESAPIDAKVTFLSPEYRQGTQITTLRAVMANPSRAFFPGMQANVIITRSARRVIAIPADALIRDEHGSHVWILQNDGSFKPRQVRTGLDNVDKVEIVEGLQEKENVVISGAYLLYSDWVLKKGTDPGKR
jgi:Cu(I)/Ag(I) efflux system membrane fusion protein